VRKRRRADSASLDDFWSALVFARAASPWQSQPSGRFRRTSVYACEVHSEARQHWAQVVIAAFRNMTRTASMDTVSVEFGGGWSGYEVLCKGAAALEAWQVSCPAYGDLQPVESMEKLVSDIPECDRNGLRRVKSDIG
jgi:hypothetical protein